MDGSTSKKRWSVVGVGAAAFVLAGTLTAHAASFSNQGATAGLDYTTTEVGDMPGPPDGGGATVGDFNNDGWPDLFVLGTGSRPDGLFINNRDGTFTDQAAAWGVAVTHRGQGVTVGDFDGDGWQDIFVSGCGDMTDVPRTGQHRLYRNNGNGSFTNVAVAAGVNSTSSTELISKGAAFGDYDLDGDLDLFVCSWKNIGGTTDGNRLFRNDGDGTFTDVTVAAGVFNDTIYGFAPRFADMNGDRYPELLLAADFQTSRYFVNNGDGTFTDATAASGTGLDRNGMGQAVADINNDGLYDWYVTSIYRDSHPPNTGNFLYLNLGNDVFSPLPESAGVTDGGWGWGTAAIDIDHDGLVDLAETNGWRQSEFENEQSYLFRNNGDLTFTDIAIPSGFAYYGEGRALVQLDYDRDGDMDILIVSAGAPLVFFRNEVSGPATNWLEVILDTHGVAGLAPNGVGSKLVATTGGVSRYFNLSGGDNYLGEGQLVAHFGLGSSTVVDQLIVLWANGATTALANVAANQILTVAAPGLAPPGEASSPTASPLLLGKGAGTSLVVTYAATPCAIDHVAYWSDAVKAGPLVWTGQACNLGMSGSATFDPGQPAPGHVLSFVLAGTDGAVEGSYGRDSSGAERPEATTLDSCNYPQQLAGACLGP